MCEVVQQNLVDYAVLEGGTAPGGGAGAGKVVVHMPKVMFNMWEGRGCSPIDHRQDSPVDVLQHCLSLLGALLQQTIERDCLRRLQGKGARSHTLKLHRPHPLHRQVAGPSHLEVSILWATELQEQL